MGAELSQEALFRYQALQGSSGAAFEALPMGQRLQQPDQLAEGELAEGAQSDERCRMGCPA